MADIKDIIEDIILKEVRQPLWENWYIREKIGSGAFAIVYRVEAQRAGRVDSSALKIEVVTSGDQVFTDAARKNSFLAQRRSMVENETNMMVDLRDCPYVVRYEDETMKELYLDGEFEGYYYLIRMELLTAVTDLMKKRDFDFSEENIRKVAHDIGSGLSAAHAKGIIHRDIKPGNFFVSEAGTYKLGDFNIAKQAASTRSFAGTDYYMAPEVFRAKTHAEVRYTKQADIYSLGICLYQMMNRGLLPFEDKMPTEDAIDKRLTGAELPPPCDASPEFARIILRACECNTAARYRTIDDMLEDLKGNTVVETETVYDRDDLKTTYLSSDEIDGRDTTAAAASAAPVPDAASVRSPAAAEAGSTKASNSKAKAPRAERAPKAVNAPKAKAVKPAVSSKVPGAAGGDGTKPAIKPVVLISALLAAVLLFSVVFFGIRSSVKKQMIDVASHFSNAVASADADAIARYSSDASLSDDISETFDFTVRGPYNDDKAALLNAIADRATYSIYEDSVKLNLGASSGSVDVLFEYPDYDEFLSTLGNIHTRSEMLSDFARTDSTIEAKVTLKLAKIDGKWLVTNVEKILETVMDYVDREVIIMSSLADGISGVNWCFSDPDGNYTDVNSIDLDLDRDDYSLDWSGVHYVVERDGEVIFRSSSSTSSCYGYYGYSQGAQLDDDGDLPAGTYTITFYDENEAYIASGTTHVS